MASITILVPSVQPVTFQNLNPQSHNYIIITHSSLQQPGGAYGDPVQAYADYRASAAGGGFSPLIADIQQLYDQFSYGEVTPLAIFRFMKYFTTINAPSYLFLIGKGLDVTYRYHRNPSDFPIYKDLVPSAGMPASDFIYTAGLLGTAYEQAIPTGRITASRPEEVAAYLEKVKETESKAYNDLRRKNILHLSGGNYPGEPERFKGYLNEFATIAKDYYFGAHVDALAKESYDIELINISDEINKGLGLVTYFGHSAAYSLDFDIGKVSDPVMGYNNPGKYPMMLMNGCNIGSYFLNDEMVGEDWILTPQKGAVGFMAHTNFGLENTIRRYADQMYKVAFSDSSFIHESIGKIQKEVSKRFMLASFPSALNITQVQQMILLGDPAVPLFGSRKPDLEITPNDISVISFNDEPITAQSDSFAINIIIRNYGMARPDTLQVQVKRYLNDNALLTYDSLFMPVKYSDTLTFIIRKGREIAGGNNTFEISLDPEDIINEIRNDNNSASIGLPIPLNGTKNLFPSKYSIVHTTTPSLTFQATDVFSDERDFLIEFDTIPTFDSPYKKSFVTTAQVLSRLSVELSTADSTVYYWRTKLKDVLPGESEDWALSSFTYIENGPEGWAQIHFPQYFENAAEGLIKDAVKQQLTFEKSITPVTIATYGIDHITTNRDVSVKIDGIEYHIHNQGYTCRDNSLNLIAFNKQSTAPYPGVYMTWYNKANRACGRVPWVINNYRYNEMAVGNGTDLIAYIDNVAAGDSVVLFSIGNANYTLWPAAAKTKLGEFGISAAQLASLINGDPVVIFAKKGATPGSAQVFQTSDVPAKAQPLLVDKTITGGYTSGSMTTVTIGPALHWESFIATTQIKEASDQTAFDLIGVKGNGEHILLQTVSNDYDLTTVSALEYPYLKVQYRVADPVNSTPAQLKNWFVLYTPAPEGLLLMQGTNEPVTFQEGQPWMEA
ncbi:MAG TPA: C25 family cysteine peptidase, partial [Chitinophagaceae bacterium]|nr:C25 family cysteine peptidase [Chitinophagaceae bacterium]